MRSIVDFFDSLDALFFLVVVLLGLACSNYVAVLWVRHLLGQGHWIGASALALGTAGFAVAALARIPLALILVFSLAAILGVAVVTGTTDIFIPSASWQGARAQAVAASDRPAAASRRSGDTLSAGVPECTRAA